MGTSDIGDRYIAVTVEVDRKPLDEVLARLNQKGLISQEAAEEISCSSRLGGDELINLEFIRMPWRAACRVVMKPGKKLLDLLHKKDG